MTVNVLSDHYLTIHPVVLTKLKTKGETEKADSHPGIFYFLSKLFWEKTKSKIWEKIMKTEQCRCQPRTEAGISVIRLRLWRGEKDCKRANNQPTSIFKYKDGTGRLSNFVFLANLSSAAGSSALASSNWICLHWDYLQYNLAPLYFSIIFLLNNF